MTPDPWYVDTIKMLVTALPMAGLLLLLIRTWMTNIQKAIEGKAPKAELAIHVNNFKEDIKTMNGEVKQSFDKLIEKMDEQIKANGDVKVEVAKLTQRVDDMRKDNGK